MRWGDRKGELGIGNAEGGIFRFWPALARRLQFISTEREEKGVGVNIDKHHKAGLGQGFGILDCGMGKKG
jgi:hypothetical protein